MTFWVEDLAKAALVDQLPHGLQGREAIGHVRLHQLQHVQDWLVHLKSSGSRIWAFSWSRKSEWFSDLKIHPGVPQPSKTRRCEAASSARAAKPSYRHGYLPYTLQDCAKVSFQPGKWLTWWMKQWIWGILFPGQTHSSSIPRPVLGLGLILMIPAMRTTNSSLAWAAAPRIPAILGSQDYWIMVDYIWLYYIFMNFYG